MKMTKCLLTVIVIIFVPVVSAGAGSGTVTVSSDSTGMYNSIQQAIDNVASGTIIRIGAGIYEENLIINKPLKIQGSGWDYVTIMPKPAKIGSAEKLNKLIENKMRSAKSDNERNVIETELKRKYFSSTVFVKDVGNVEIRDLKITALGRDGKAQSFAQAIVQFQNAKALLSKCVIIGGPKNGITIKDGSNVRIKNCLIAAVWSTGVVVEKRENNGSDVAILDSDVRNCHYAGMRIRPGNDSVTVKRCRVSGAAWHGIRYDDASPKIIENIIFGNARSGIYASGKTSATVKQNLFYKNEMNGISCWGQNGDTIRENTFASNLREGLTIVGPSCRPIIQNNIFFDNPWALICWKLEEAETKLENNLFWKNKAGILAKSKKDESGGVISDEIQLAEVSGSIMTDPMFRNAPEQNFSLLPESPARSKGIGVTSHIEFGSSWELQPEEIAIIPSSDTRDYQMWNKPGQSVPEIKEQKVTPTTKVDEDKAARQTARRANQINKLLDEKNRLEMVLIERKRMLNLPDAETRLAEYKKKLAELKNPKSKHISEEVGKKHQQQWEQFKKLHGDKWEKAYSKIRSAISQTIIIEAMDSEIEPFVRMMYTGSKEGREQLCRILGVDADTNPTELWLAYKTYGVALNKSANQDHLEKLIQQYDVPEAVVEHARQDSKKEYYGFGYKFLIDLFSREKMQETQKELEKIEGKLANYNN